MPVAPLRLPRTASYEVLCSGYVGDRVASTVSLVEEGALRAVIDPGMVASRDAILKPLARRGIRPREITDIVLSHHHPDHTLHCALFPNAKVHDFWAEYEHDVWTSRPAEGHHLSRSVVLWETPGHTPQDITTLVGTPDGVVAFTHLWWDRSGPTPDPLATDPALIARNRRRVLSVARTIVPGHGAPFVPPRRGPR
jgi:glyoxylase-like metal-dependent hydrolase (beta-lactamase superfamily II)